MKTKRVSRSLLVTAALASACGAVVSGKGGDSETHWLAECDRDAECGTEGACVCGLCTVRCESSADCADGPAGSQCVQGSGAPICGGDQSIAGICLVACTTHSDCASGEICVLGACVEGDKSQLIDNPTGDCVAMGTGEHVGYSVPGVDDVWLPDCENPLDREYYRVFAQSETSAYVIPRLDGAKALSEPCNDSQHPLAALVAKYGLCESATTQEQVDIINHMLPADALAITHYLHTVLVFAPSFTGIGIEPFPIPGDVLDACALHPELTSAEFQSLCDTVKQVVETGVDIGFTYTGFAGFELAGRLNELYGIGPDCAPEEVPGLVCTQCGVIGGCGATELRCTRPCTQTTECSGSSSGAYCMGGYCGPVTGCI